MDDQSQMEAAAYHEAGHAVIAWRHRRFVGERGLSIESGGFGHAHVRRIVLPGEGDASKASGDERIWKAYCLRVTAHVEVYQAGRLAEHLHHGEGAGRYTANSVKDAIYGSESYGLVDKLNDNEEVDDLDSVLDALIEVRRVETGHYRLSDADREWIVREFLRIQKRLVLILRRQRTWRAIESVAKPLLERHRLGWEEVDSILEAAHPPQVSIVALDSL